MFQWLMNSNLTCFLLALILSIGQAIAADSYNPMNNQLTLPMVTVGSTVYTNAIVTVAEVLSVGSYSPTSTEDNYNNTLNQLSIPIVSVGSNLYYNVICTVGKVVSIGSSYPWVNTNLFNTPATFSNVINSKFKLTSSLVQAFTLNNRSRYLIADTITPSNTSNFLSLSSAPISKDESFGTNQGYSLISSNLTTSSSTQNYLYSIFQAVSSADGNFRFDSHMNPNDSMDYDSSNNTLLFINNFGLTSSKFNGYITFSYDPFTHLVQSRNRFIHSLNSSPVSSLAQTSYTEVYVADSNFKASNFYIKQSGGVYSLVSSASDATPLFIFNAPFDFGIPKDFNPSSTAYVSNSPAPFIVKINSSILESKSAPQSVYNTLRSIYKNQVSVVGNDSGTKFYADSMLNTIIDTAKSNNFSLRYNPLIYRAYRDATLSYTLVSDDVADGVPGQRLVPYVYFTNEADSSGQYHPMMVIVHYGNQASPNGLIDINRPPGAGGSGGYSNGFVTRYSNLDNFVTAIPMRDYGTVSSVFQNKFNPSLLSDTGVTPSDSNVTVYNYASTADNGILIDGSVIFPVMNNTLVPSQSMAELSASGCHVGQGGGGPHCHADGYVSGTQYGTSVYGDLDYVGMSHPPLIGFGYDGIALFGQYRFGLGVNDSNLQGASLALDNFGGHNHDGLGYHYHAHTATWPGNGNIPSFVLHVLLNGAWAGNVNNIPYFYKASNFKNNPYLGGM